MIKLVERHARAPGPGLQRSQWSRGDFWQRGKRLGWIDRGWDVDQETAISIIIN